MTCAWGIFWWLGPIQEGNGVRQLIIDEHATATQREALRALDSETHGGPIWEMFAAVCPTVLEPLIHAAANLASFLLGKNPQSLGLHALHRIWCEK